MIKGLGTHLKVSDFSASHKFYTDLGFQKIFEYGPDKTLEKDSNGDLLSAPEEYNGAVFEHGGCKLEIADGHRAVKPETFQKEISNSKTSLMVYVDSVSEVIEKCRVVNIPLAVGPRHYYWGTIEIVVKDPDGFVLVFITPYTKKEAEAVKADETWALPPQ